MNEPARSATPASDIAVELRGVAKTYRQRERAAGVGGAVRAMLRPRIREVHALAGVDLVVRRGEVLAYAGPNGAGKSTTIKLLAGILGPDEGEVRVNGRDPVRDRRHHVAEIGVVFGQRGELWHDHPVSASFEWKRVVWDVPDERYHRMLGVLRELLDLDDVLPALARELSLGQRMRAELALALLHEPALLLLDEPTIGLDVLGKRRMLQFVKDLKEVKGGVPGVGGRKGGVPGVGGRKGGVPGVGGRKGGVGSGGSLGTTVIVTSHDMSDLEQLAERIVMIDRGRIAFDGDFPTLRRTVSTTRRLLVETASQSAPVLEHAELVASAAGRHTYVYDPKATDVARLLAAASAVTEVLDVETHRPDIDDVVADLYASWRGGPS